MQLQNIKVNSGAAKAIDSRQNEPMKLPPPKSSAPVNIDLGSGINTSLSLKEMSKEKKLGISQLLDQEILP